jgi:diguanylate cyclase (GGDEF)-like protein
MKKQRKLIGVIVGQVAGNYQTQLLTGICNTAFPHNYDVAVFSMFVKQWAKPLHQVGQKNIYNLINYELFDGIIIVPDTLRIPGLIEHLQNELRDKFDGPVISIDYELDGFTNIFTDDYNSIKIMINHLIDAHNVKNFAFMTGPKDHPHAIRRLEGALHAVKSHGITVKEDHIFYGDFWYNMGQEVAQELLKFKTLPEALVCMSDTMAISVCDALATYGVIAPHHIIITGYDAISIAGNRNSYITSMELKSEKLGIKAMFEIIQALEKIPLIQDYDTLAVLKVNESCGCQEKNSTARASTPYTDSDYQDPFYNAYNYMMEELMSTNDLNNLLEQICYYTFQLKDYDNFYLALCDNWDYVGCSYEASQNYNIDHYTSKMHLKITKGVEDRIRNDTSFPVSIMIPAIWTERSTPSVFHFNPVHFSDRCFGYTVIEFTNRVKSLEFCYRDWVRYVGIALENLRVKNNFIWSNQQLEEYAQIDGLTKIYNRNGYTKFSESFYETALRDEKELFILMGDLNDLKGINDTFGHIEGDSAIQLCAVAFQRTCSQSEKCFRYGGDEFILLGVNHYSKTDVLLFEKGIQSYLRAYNEVSEKPYKVSISLGFWHGNVDNQHTLDDYVMLADKLMFNSKLRDKSKRKSRP